MLYRRSTEKGEALAGIKKQHLGQLSVLMIDSSNSTEKAQHDKLVALVENMLELQEISRCENGAR